MKTGTVLAGLIFFCCGAAMIWGALLLPESRTADVGAGRLPLIIGLAIMAMSALVAASGFFALEAAASGQPAEADERPQAGAFLLMLGTLAFVLAIDHFGYLVASTVFILAFVYLASTRRRAFTAVATWACSTAFTYLLFQLILDLPLP